MIKLPFNLKPDQTPGKFLTIDIGSDSIKIGLFETHDGEKGAIAVLEGYTKKDISDIATRSGVIVEFEEVLSAISDAILELDPEGLAQEVVFGVGGNLSIGLTTTVKVTRGKNDAISEKEVSEINEKIMGAAYDEIQKIYLEITGDSEVEVQMVTSSTVYSKLDGRKTDELVGAIGQVIEVAVFTAFVPEYHLQALRDLAESLELNIVAVGSNMYSIVRSLAFSKEKNYDAIIMDIGGDMTDVAVVFGGGIVGTRSLDIGGVHFTKTLATETEKSFKEAETKKVDYAQGKLDEEEAVLVRGYLENTLYTWLDGVELLFQDFTGVKTFAPNVYMLGGGSGLPDILEVLSKEPWTKSIPFKSPPEFSKLSIENFPLVSDRTGKAADTQSLVPVALSIVYLEAKGFIN